MIAMYILLVFGIILGLSVLITLLAMVIRSDNWVRLVSLEVLANLLISLIALWALVIHAETLLDICLALALIMFLSTVAYCQYLSRKHQ